MYKYARRNTAEVCCYTAWVPTGANIAVGSDSSSVKKQSIFTRAPLQKRRVLSDELAPKPGIDSTRIRGDIVQAAVIVAHTAIGPHDDFIQSIIRDLAVKGYVAFALDMFGEPDVVLGVHHALNHWLM